VVVDFLNKKSIFPKSLLVAAMLFNTVVMAANFVGQKPLLVFGLVISSGSILFPLTYLITVIVTEIFGRESAKNIIIIGFMCNIIVAGFILLSIQFPSPAFWMNQVPYQTIMQQMWKIFVLSSVAYIVSEYTNLNVFTYFTKRFKQKYFQLRVFYSTGCAVIVDTLFLIPIMMSSSPSCLVVLHKIISLITFKCIFVFTGIIFISFIRDYIAKIENERKQQVEFLYYNRNSSENSDPSLTNVVWYQKT